MAKPLRYGKPWTPQEVALLKQHYRNGTLHRKIAAELKRTLVAVESKAMELRLKSKRRKK